MPDSRSLSILRCRMPLLGLLLAVLQPFSAAAHEAEVSPQALDRAGLAAARARIETRYREARQDCAHRFAVNACEQAARQERGAALAPLITREQVLDAQERQSRAEAQRQRVLEKQRAAAEEEGQRRQRELSAAPRVGAPVAPVLPVAPAASRPVPPRVDAQAHGQTVQREIERGEQQAQRQRERAAQRQREAQAHREAQARREKEKAAQPRPAAAALPVPSASDIEALPAGPKR